MKELPRSGYLSVLYDTRNDRCLIFLAIDGRGRWSENRLWSDGRNEYKEPRLIHRIMGEMSQDSNWPDQIHQ